MLQDSRLQDCNELWPLGTLLINAPINAKPHTTPPGHRWGFAQLIIQKTHPSGKFFHIRRNLHGS